MGLFRSIMGFAKSLSGSRAAINTAARNVARTADPLARHGVPSVGRSATQAIAVATHNDATAIGTAVAGAALVGGAALIARNAIKKKDW